MEGFYFSETPAEVVFLARLLLVLFIVVVAQAVALAVLFISCYLMDKENRAAMCRSNVWTLQELLARDRTICNLNGSLQALREENKARDAAHIASVNSAVQFVRSLMHKEVAERNDTISSLNANIYALYGSIQEVREENKELFVALQTEREESKALRSSLQTMSEENKTRDATITSLNASIQTMREEKKSRDAAELAAPLQAMRRTSELKSKQLVEMTAIAKDLVGQVRAMKNVIASHPVATPPSKVRPSEHETARQLHADAREVKSEIATCYERDLDLSGTPRKRSCSSTNPNATPLSPSSSSYTLVAPSLPSCLSSETLPVEVAATCPIPSSATVVAPTKPFELLDEILEYFVGSNPFSAPQSLETPRSTPLPTPSLAGPGSSLLSLAIS